MNSKLSVLEKVGYSLGDLSANLVFQTLMTYLAYFYTDVYGLAPKVATPVIFTVGMVAAFAFNPVIGALADRTHTRWGKFRPWILFTALPLSLAALLAFTTPDFDEKGKVIYAVITYSLLLFLYAANNLPYAALSGVITGDMGERNSLSSYRFVAVMVAQFSVQSLMYPMIEYLGNGDKAAGFSRVMIYLAVIGAVLMLITFFTTRERIVPAREQRSSLGQDLADLTRNRPWFIMLVTTILVFVTLAMKGGTYLYYFENYVDKEALSAFLANFGVKDSGKPAATGFSIFNGLGIIFMIIGITFSKRFADKYGKRDTFMASLFLSTLPILMFYVYSPGSLGLIFGSQIIHGLFYGISTPILWAMIADVADYSEWKNHRRATAIIFSAMMVGLKAGLTLGQTFITGILNYFHYIPNTVQSAETVNGIKLTVSILAAIPFLLAVALLFFYKIDKKTEVQIENDLKVRRL
ncbi:MAG: glycoside-pentoside-hexuronide (GPH):cation symporter [Leadbetterella sp.]|nr:glycoside-pentoside-hexuronide (GPH):cation symporter [Leadbetterella sp.]